MTEAESKVVNIHEARKKQPKKILQKDFQNAEYAHQRASVTIPADWKPEDALKPEFWANVAHLLAYDDVSKRPARIGTIIELRSEDHSFYAELYVRGVTKNAMTVEWLTEPKYFGPKESSAPKNDKYKHRWNVGKRHYEVIRLEDDEIVANFPMKEDVFKYIGSMK